MSEFCFAQMMHGSRLFGTAHKDSDIDIQSVWIPSSEDILLGEVNWTVVNNGSTRVNTRDDVDHGRHDLLKYLNLVAAGQPIAIEMLFVPDRLHLVDPHTAWSSIRDNALRIIPRAHGKFMGNLEEQAIAFGIKGERHTAASRALHLLETFESRPETNVGAVAELVVQTAESRHISIDRTKMSPEGHPQPALRIGRHLIPFSEPASVAAKMARLVVDSYGQRAHQLALGAFNDWKSLSHAVRLAGEARELYSTGRITFPRPDAEYLVAIRQAKVPTEEITQVIGDLMDDVAAAVRTSELSDVADRALLNSYVVEAYGDQVRRDRTHEDRHELEAFM